MITISRNPNFKEWLNITMFGKLVDNAKNSARAYHVAQKLQIEHKQKTGERVIIVKKN
tara:strand:- start:8769 stop:8942 length:174 start_codon:yes stop_codon:yes gene_type:complete